MNKNILLLGGALLVLGGSFFLLQGDKKQEENKINNSGENVELVKVIMLDGVEDANVLFDFAGEKGFFGKYNIEIEKIIVETNSSGALVSGVGDIRMTEITGGLGLYLSDVNIKVIGNGYKRIGTAPVSRFPLDEADSIKKVVVGRLGGAPHMVMVEILKNLGLDLNEIEFIGVSGEASRLNMLERGEADFTTVRFEDSFFESGLMESLYLYDDPKLLDSSILRGALITTNSALEKKPEALRRFTLAIYETLQYMHGNREELKEFLIEKEGLFPEQAEELAGNFVIAIDGLDYIPRKEEIERFIEPVKKVFDPTNPGRDITDFIFDEFAREAVGE